MTRFASKVLQLVLQKYGEVLGGLPSSDFWSVGVTLADWLIPPAIFGAGDKLVGDLTEIWCIAKIQRLVGKIGPATENEDFHMEFAVTEYLDGTFIDPDTKLESQHIAIGTLRQELQKLRDPKVSPDLIELIEFLLVFNDTKRPTALSALKHPYLHSIV